MAMISEMIDGTGLTDTELQERAEKGGYYLSRSSVWMYRHGTPWRPNALPRMTTVEALSYALDRTCAEVLVGFLEMNGNAPAGLTEHLRQAEERLIAEQSRKRRPRRAGR